MVSAGNVRVNTYMVQHIGNVRKDLMDYVCGAQGGWKREPKSRSVVGNEPVGESA
jgi:hypothetical protein